MLGDDTWHVSWPDGAFALAAFHPQVEDGYVMYTESWQMDDGAS